MEEELEIRRFWVSWWEPMEDGDYRPLSLPLPEAIPAWWCSGEDLNDRASLCAVVDAADLDEVRLLIMDYWRPAEWRFIEERDPDWRPNDRFPWPEEKDDEQPGN